MATVKQLAALKKARLAKKKKPIAKKLSVKSPVKKYAIKITTQDGRIGYIAANGLDSELANAKRYLASSSEKIAREYFYKNKKYLHKVEVVPVKKREGTGYKKNPVPQSSKAKIREAAQLFEDFTGHDAAYFDEVPVKWPDVAMRVGQCDGIMYETVRDGKVEHYVHKFKKNARPILVAAHDGKHLGLIGGKFSFTERGIVDN